jgi:4-aminobutyrate aminotransferase-like enzyme
MKELLDGGLVKNSEKMGAYLYEKLSGLKDKYPIIKEVRGKGLIIGMELTAEKAAEIRKAAGGRAASHREQTQSGIFFSSGDDEHI